MSLGNTQRPIYLSISKDSGRLTRKADAGRPAEEFDYCEGRLKSLAVVTRDFGGQAAEMVQIVLEDADTGETYQIGTSLHGSAGRGLVLSLASAQRFDVIRLNFYKNRDGFQKALAFEHDEKLPWAEPMPAAEYIEGVKDETRRVDFFKSQAARLSERVKSFWARELDDVPF